MTTITTTEKTTDTEKCKSTAVDKSEVTEILKNYMTLAEWHKEARLFAVGLIMAFIAAMGFLGNIFNNSTNNNTKAEIAPVRTEITAVRGEIAVIRTEMTAKIDSLQKDNVRMESDIKDMKASLANIEKHLIAKK